MKIKLTLISLFAINNLVIASPTSICTQTNYETQADCHHDYTREQRRCTEHDLIHQVGDAWQVHPPQCYKPQPLSSTARIKHKLHSIFVPKVSFAQTPLSQVTDILSELAFQLDETTEDPEQKGLNFVLIDPDNTNPKLNLTLRNTSLYQILNIITKSSGFYYTVNNNVITILPGVHPHADLETAFFPITRATIIRMTGNRSPQCHTDGCDLYKTSHPDQYEEEILIKNFFQRAGVPFDLDLGGPIGAQLAFDGTQLIATQTPENIDKIFNILDRYKDSFQVEIEAKFIEVQQGVLEELGVQWQVASKHNPNNKFFQTTKDGNNNLRTLADAFATNNSSTGDGQIIMPSTDPVNISNKAPTFPNALNLAANSVNTASILSVIDNWDVNMLIKALEQHTGSNLMSAPKVTVLSGKTAKITVAQVMRYPQAFGDIQSAVGTAGADAKNSSAGVTITAGTPQDFAEKNVGVEMEVTPTVEHTADAISLKLEPTVTEFEGFVEYGGRSLAISGDTAIHVPSGFFQPIFSTRQIQTEVTIDNGATVIMGGLTREEVKKTYDKVPLLGDIPLLGRLFRSKGETNQKRNLLIFVTANILSNAGCAVDS